MPAKTCVHHWILDNQTPAAHGKCVLCGNERDFNGGVKDLYSDFTVSNYLSYAKKEQIRRNRLAEDAA